MVKAPRPRRDQVEHWVAQRLAHRLGQGRVGGICANVLFDPPWTLVHEALAATIALNPDGDPWRSDLLAWHVLAAIKQSTHAMRLVQVDYGHSPPVQGHTCGSKSAEHRSRRNRALSPKSGLIHLAATIAETWLASASRRDSAADCT
ncbi:exodeoxyribonuclease V subunit gamma [Cellulomonas fengjieae]|uniref:Exodeoxyribonuclease V subunit gamma n=1 Tax=Cellulomonas fengjieae TaxID=2819978 RepID=A0ABS3SF32_9CELL|nr:exodeoxyribonuclease V subunit gamma [Cellulomonas fengjieae]QVI64641.1 exodeoxyribonuclease V subunit gamma [Cellulomonas fengjieae]